MSSTSFDLFNILGFFAGILGIGIAILIYHRQSKTDDMVAELILDVHTFTAQQTAIQDSIKASGFNNIIGNLKASQGQIHALVFWLESSLKKSDGTPGLGIPSSPIIQTFDQAIRKYQIYQSYAEYVLVHLGNIRSLIDGPLADKIERVGSRIKILLTPSNENLDESQRGVYWIHIPDTLISWHNLAKEVQKEIDELVNQDIPASLTRIVKRDK